MLCVYAIAPLLNDFFALQFRLSPRLTLIPTAAVFFCTAFSGHLGRALKVPLGRWWLALIVLMIAATPFSFWPGGSTAMLQDYVPRRYVLLFCICALQVTLGQQIRFAYVNILSTALILFLCLRYGTVSDSDGRFFILESLFFDNSNDLAIGLLCAATSVLFVFFARGFLLKIIAGSEIVLCLFYILKTGSRGTFIAVLVAAMVAMMFAKKRLLLMLLVPALLIGLIAIAPSQTLKRLVSIVADPEAQVAAGTAGGDVESQLQRQDLLKMSLKLTITHPILGVGPGMFDNFVQQRAKQAGTHIASLNTHNSYTQISSECGIPALICYVATLVLTIKINYRIYRALVKKQGQVDGRITGIAFSGFIGCIAFVVAGFFHHIAYGGYQPLLAGEAIALWLATRPILESPRPSPRG